MAAFPLSVLALAAGVYLLVKVKREFLGGIFEILSWLVIVLSLVSIGFLGFKTFSHCGGGHCGQTRECKIEKQVIIKDGSGHCEMNSSSTCSMEGCKMEGDSVVMEKEMCEKMMGKEACDAMSKERGRCVMSKEECMKMCHAAEKPCCAEKSEGTCTMHKEGEATGKCSMGEKKECCKKKM
jgi:hypothetical protein